jgi:hypothetical protein
MNTLIDIGFGADIDSLESYLIDYRHAELVSDLSLYAYNHLKLMQILQEIRSGSVALNSSNRLTKTKLDENKDIRFRETPNKYIEMSYGINSQKLEAFRSNLRLGVNESRDLIALTNIQGINIKCVYIEGELDSVNLIGDNAKYTDITEQVEDLLPNSIDELERFGVVELRGKLTISNNNKALQNKSLCIECATMHCIRTDTNIDKLAIVINDILLDNFVYEDMPFHTQWEKMEYLEDLEFNIPEYSLVRGVFEDTLGSALNGFNEHFNEIEEAGTDFKFNSIDVRINNKLKCYDQDERIIYNSKDYNSNSIFTSTIKSINTKFKNNRIIAVLNIVDTQCNDELVISEIDIDDIYMIESNELKIGGQVRFCISERKAVPYFSKK